MGKPWVEKNYSDNSEGEKNLVKEHTIVEKMKSLAEVMYIDVYFDQILEIIAGLSISFYLTLWAFLFQSLQSCEKCI